MKEYLGKKVLWVFENRKTRLWMEQIRCARVMEISPSETFVRLDEGAYSSWYLSTAIHVLEVLDDRVPEK